MELTPNNIIVHYKQDPKHNTQKMCVERTKQSKTVKYFCPLPSKLLIQCLFLREHGFPRSPSTSKDRESSPEAWAWPALGRAESSAAAPELLLVLCLCLPRPVSFLFQSAWVLTYHISLLPSKCYIWNLGKSTEIILQLEWGEESWGICWGMLTLSSLDSKNSGRSCQGLGRAFLGGEIYWKSLI